MSKEFNSIDDLKPAPYNPRKIEAKAAGGLAKSIQMYSDVSGIVWNKRTGHLVTGHQRVDQLRKLGAQVVDGALVLDGERFPVRVVDWGNAEELWRLWYGGLSGSERLTFRNEIVWDKEHGMGMSSDNHRQFPTATERCIFFMLGEQGFNNNADNYWDGWDSVLDYLQKECKAVGWGPKEIKEICGVGMYAHWFTESQWTFIPERHYLAIQVAANNQAFQKDYQAFQKDYQALQKDYQALQKEFYKSRAHFDNTHDNMTDVWKFGRVTGDERHGHATPKPVEMMARCINSSSKAGDIVAEPFLGSGTTLIAAEQLGRKCYGVELSPAYVDVVIQRWENLTGKKATRVSV